MNLKQSNAGLLVKGMVHQFQDLLESKINVTPSSLGNGTTPYPSPNSSEIPLELSPCQWIIYSELGHSRVRIWDVIILIPNAIFFLFLLLGLKTTIVKLHRTNSPIFFAFYGLVFAVALISVLRCVVSMTVNAAVKAGDITDKVLWLILRFFLLATELSVVVFGLAFGHLDSRTSIQRVLLVTSCLALIYSCTQGTLEFLFPDGTFHVKNENREYDIFAHGGMLFWFASSVFFFVIYSVICFLPFTQLRERFALPTRKSFYWYSLFLGLLNLVQAVGSGLLRYGEINGLCIVDVTCYIYFTGYAPLVYGTFLRDFFATSQPPTILFSYKAQVDESLEEDSVSLPHQMPGGKLEADLGAAASYDSTHFDGLSPNPLYQPEHLFPVHAEMNNVLDDNFDEGTRVIIAHGIPPSSESINN